MWSSTSIASTNTGATLPGLQLAPPCAQSGLTVRPNCAHAGSDPGDLALFEGLDQVAALEILEVGEADAAFEALADLAGVLLEATQRDDRALPDDHAVAQEAHLGATGDDARAHVAT